MNNWVCRGISCTFRSKILRQTRLLLRKRRTEPRSTKGCTPEDRGVVCYEFGEFEENRETETGFASVPVTVPASASQSSSSTSSVPMRGKAVLRIILELRS